MQAAAAVKIWRHSGNDSLDDGTKKQRVYEMWEDNFHDPVSYANFYFNEVYGKYFTENQKMFI